MWKRAISGSGSGGGGIKAFYSIGGGRSNYSYAFYSSVAEEMKTQYVTNSATMFDDEYITITYTANHTTTLTYKKDGYFCQGSSSDGATTTPVAKSAGSVVTVNDTWSYCLLVAYFT